MDENPRILIVDDDEGASRTLSLVFGRKGYDTETATTGQEAIEKAQGRSFNLTLLDIKLPDIDGVELLGPLKEMRPDMAVIMITGHASLETAVQALNEGASAYITKPLNMDEVLATVRQALEKQRLIQEKRRAEAGQRKALAAKEEALARALQATHALRESEEKYRLISENTGDCIAITGLNRKFIYASPSYRRLGYEPDELIGTDSFESVHPDDKKRLLPMLKQVVSGVFKRGAGKRVELRLRDKAGKYHYIESTANIIREQSGKLAILSVFRNITDRKQAEVALRASEEKHRTILESIEDGYYEVDLVGNLTFFNDSLCRLYGYSEDELMGMNNRQYMDDETAKIVYQTFNAVYRTRKPARAFDWELIRKDGTRSFVDVSVSLIRSSTGEPTGFRGIVRDITERKRAEEALRRHLERIEALREIDRAITSTLDLSGVLDIILKELARVIPYHSAAIFLLSDGTAKLTAGRGFPDLERALQVSFPVNEDPLTRELLQEERPLVLADAQADERFRARGGADYVRSWIGAPLIAKGMAVGFLTIDHREPGVYDEESAEMAEAFAGQVAIAIENARLYEEAQQELAERKRAEEELRQGLERLRMSLEGTVNVLVSAIEIRDPFTAGHQRQATQLACAIAREMGLPEEQSEGLRMAGLIHDLGKISIPAEILSKPTRLTEFEWGMIQAHPQVGYDILKTAEFPWPVAQIVLQHHERMDGSGYSQGLAGEDILLEARILAVADVVEAMASFRPYRPARGLDKALEEISQNKGVLYDSEVVDACLKLFIEKEFAFE